MKAKTDTRLFDAYVERTAYVYNNFRHLLIRIRLEENLVKEKEPNNYFLVT